MKFWQSITYFPGDSHVLSYSPPSLPVSSILVTSTKCLRLFVNSESIHYGSATAMINHSVGQPYHCNDTSHLSESNIVNPLTAVLYNVLEYRGRSTFIAFNYLENSRFSEQFRIDFSSARMSRHRSFSSYKRLRKKNFSQNKLQGTK